MTMGTVVTEFQRRLEEVRQEGHVAVLVQLIARKFGQGAEWLNCDLRAATMRSPVPLSQHRLSSPMKDFHVPTLEDVVTTWEPRLRKRIGGRKLLSGLTVYHDFPWQPLIGHPRTTFPNGKDLAGQIRRDCPDGMTPVLLLTTRHDVDEGVLETRDTSYIFVIHIVEYLNSAHAGAAVNYLSGGIGAGALTAIRQAKQRIPDSVNVAALLDQHLTEANLGEWVRRKAGRERVLQRIVSPSVHHPGARENPLHPIGPKSFITDATPGEIQTLVDEIVATAEGRSAIGKTDLVPYRIAAAREKVQEYSDLLLESGTSETDLQKFIEDNPSLLGLEYIKTIPQKQILRCVVDFLVQRHDGYHDLLELKGPHDEIIRFTGRPGRDEARASAYALSPRLAQALAQVHLYREELAKITKEVLKETYHIENVRNPRVTIVIGQGSNLPNETAKRILHQLNLTLHRMEVVPYDWLAERAETQWKNATIFT